MLMSTKQKQPEQPALPTSDQQPEVQKAEAPKPTGSAQGKTAVEVLSPFRQRLAKYFEDQQPDLTADAEADRLACQWADDLEGRLARYADTEGRVTGLLERQPHVAELLQQLLDDDALPLRVAVRRTLGEEGLLPQPGDDGYEAFAQQKAEAENRQAQLEANLKQSLEVLRKYADEHKLDEHDQQALVEAINADFDNLLERRITDEMLQGYLKRLRYDLDVDNARHEGELKGRNENISARMAAQKAAQLGDGLPQPQGGGYAPKMLKGQQPVIDFSKY